MARNDRLFILSYMIAQEPRPDHDAKDNLPPYQVNVSDGEQPADEPEHPRPRAHAFTVCHFCASFVTSKLI
jgi:hypothetical protein